MYLINPTTVDYHRIPVFHLGLPQQSSYRVYGFGYDFASDDYKVVNLSRYRKGNIDTTFVDVYSVRMGLWRRLESLPYDDVLSERGGASGVLVNGVFHWMASKASSLVIIGFDLSDEKFSRYQHLLIFMEMSWIGMNLGVLEGVFVCFVLY
ncbi:hypothetical protein AABB24_021528 [Solanum stoloniferum]|uniref:F-box associated beta-propeller type 1 domain-containing protein n=1 Tax=Solanum stoloniferum TaxID=62892 RepID=A0ABD2SVR3_9SOLN